VVVDAQVRPSDTAPSARSAGDPRTWYHDVTDREIQYLAPHGHYPSDHLMTEDQRTDMAGYGMRGGKGDQMRPRDELVHVSPADTGQKDLQLDLPRCGRRWIGPVLNADVASSMVDSS
jgi:hypothetical protein